MGYLIDPPRRVTGAYVAIFAQTELADELAVEFLRDRGFEAKAMPLIGDLAFDALGGLGSGALFGGNAMVCVPEEQADGALDALEFDSGLVDE